MTLEPNRQGFRGNQLFPLKIDQDGVVISEKDIFFTENVEIEEDLIVYGDIQMGNNLEIFGGLHIVGALDGDTLGLDVDNDVTIGGELNVVRDIIGTGELSITGNSLLGGDLGVAGNSIFEGTTEFNDDVHLITDLDVDGNVNIDGELTVDGQVLLGNTEIVGTTLLSSNVTIGGGTILDVNGTSTFTNQPVLDTYSPYQFIGLKSTGAPSTVYRTIVTTWNSGASPSWGTFNTGTGTFTITQKGMYLSNIGSIYTNQSESGIVFIGFKVESLYYETSASIIPSVGGRLSHSKVLCLNSGNVPYVDNTYFGTLASVGGEIDDITSTFQWTITKLS